MMAEFESDVRVPVTSGIQKPSAERYLVPVRIAERMQDKLADGTTVEASWHDCCTLSVTVSSDSDQPERAMQAAQAALQDVVGAASIVSPFHRIGREG